MSKIIRLPGDGDYIKHHTHVKTALQVRDVFYQGNSTLLVQGVWTDEHGAPSMDRAYVVIARQEASEWLILREFEVRGAEWLELGPWKLLSEV